jgi:hypothetical protein
MIIILNLFLINSHYSNNNNCFFPLLVHRLDDLIFSPRFFLCWNSLALLAFIFFTLTNNNIPLLPYSPPSTSLSTSSSSHCQLKATALQSRRGGWPPK